MWKSHEGMHGECIAIPPPEYEAAANCTTLHVTAFFGPFDLREIKERINICDKCLRAEWEMRGNKVCYIVLQCLLYGSGDTVHGSIMVIA